MTISLDIKTCAVCNQITLLEPISYIDAKVSLCSKECMNMYAFGVKPQTESAFTEKKKTMRRYTNQTPAEKL